MSFLKNNEYFNRGEHNMPRQSQPPNFIQLNAMMQTSSQTGKVCKLTFGDAPEEYSLAVFKDKRNGEIHWALYRGEGNGSMMIWDHLSNDPGLVYQMIAAQFPGLDLKQVALRGQQDGSKASVNLPAEQSWSGQREKQSNTGPIKIKPILEGDLKNIPLASILHSILMSKGTGRLEIENAREMATVFIADGEPIHCVGRGVSGEAAFIELVGWENGDFRFYQAARHEAKTIVRSLEALLIEGAALDDQFRAMRKLGAKDNAYLSRKYVSLSESEFEKILEKGTDVDLELSKRIYLRIDDRTKLIDLVRRFSLSKQQWVPIIFNLASCHLIDFKERIPELAAASIPETNIDWTPVNAAEKLLSRPDTELFNYPTLLFFLRDELARWDRFGHPFSLIMLQLSNGPDNYSEALPPSTIKEIARRIIKLKRKTDILAQFDDNLLALLLLETDLRSARAFADRLLPGISKTALKDPLSKARAINLVIKGGTACIPDDCSTLASLVDRARPILD